MSCFVNESWARRVERNSPATAASFAGWQSGGFPDILASLFRFWIAFSLRRRWVHESSEEIDARPRAGSACRNRVNSGMFRLGKDTFDILFARPNTSLIRRQGWPVTT
ncbi:hypothetical protein MAPG_04501 [Magnaporthiopsis poae ATCC 64411]|uniref:Uncharacterized protein n=1 Tax=Magnaporthiopsis poae (strain ATCC 64411 / 73-15) TaxID=644358 RepID=A0A0C4DWW7_MAGP6|nr:hypothetical protein MAPG_04501 [Magnaporthiopsis poae ATCC 64411]